MNSNCFKELVVIERSQLEDLLQTKKPQSIPEQKDDEKPTDRPKTEDKKKLLNSYFIELIQELPAKSRTPATQMLKKLLGGKEFGWDCSTGELVRYLPERGYRYRLKGSNLFDVISVLCSEPSPQIQAENIPYGMHAMLLMLSHTNLGSIQIINSDYRTLFQQYRRK